MVQSSAAKSALDRSVSSEASRLVELIPCAALLYSEDETILAANRMFCELVGYAPAELRRQRVGDLTLRQDRQRDDAARIRLLERRQTELAYEKHLLGKSGNAIRCEVALKRITESGAVRYLALVRNLDAHRPDELDVDDPRDEGELILQSIDEGFVLLDREFRVRRINDEALRIDGRPRSAIVGRTHWEVWPGSENLPLADAYRRAMRERIQMSVEQVYRHNGKDMWIEARAYPFDDNLAVFYRDITQRKQAERAIRESEAKFRTIADAMPQLVWSTRPDGFHDYFNRQWYEYTGVPEGSADGAVWAGLLHPDDRPAMQARWQHSLATGEPYETEFRLRHRSGEYRWRLGRALPVRNEDGEIVRWMGTSTDIHERIVMQATLRDTQSRLEAALTAAEIGTWTWDIPADHVRADRNLAAMFGIAEEVADAAPMAAYFDAVHPDDRGAVRAGIDRSLSTGEPYHAQFRIREAGGAIRFMQARGTVATDADGKPQRMSGAVIDVTRQRMAEEARRISESKFRTIVESNVIGIIRYRFDGTVVEANDAFLHMLGYSREHFELHGLSWRALTPPEWGEADRRARASLETTGRMEPMEKEYFHRDGSRVPVYMGAANFEGSRDEGIAYLLDIGKVKQSEAALRSSELTFRTLAENIPQLAWMADSDGFIFWYNNRWFEYTGTTLEEMRGWGWKKVHHPDYVERVVERYRKQIVEDQCIWEDTFPLRGADGQYRWFLSRAMPIRDQQGRVMRWLGTNTDVTLQREAEEELQQANRRKDDFLAMLAHELRNPLAPISTAAQLLKMGERNAENIRRSSEIIDRQVKHMTDLVNDLMDVSRVTRGLVSIEKEEVSVAFVVNSAIEQARPLIEAHRQELVLDQGDGDVIVLGDRSRLIQVLTNLLNNAAKYTQQGGRITLTVRVRGAQIDISVADNGIGIDATLLPHVFELFSQAERTPDRGEGGLGLGLALVKSIVVLHNGHIAASSAGRGMGSTFSVSLPLLPEDGACETSSHTDRVAVRVLRILLIDRAEDGDAALSAALQSDGHTVALCRDGSCAQARASELHPDAVLIRTDLPDLDGYALARQLRALHPHEQALYIALSSTCQSHDKIVARSAGFDHHLEWPVALTSLRKILAMTSL
ncbi:PAS/PAC sensor hybrid histidine kinase [Caballeronia calidae]|uniref:histidine kinase n=2 Tax=Caballeronia calidae TaxID=1777139 RepID=A0A158A5J4_9BURK|nr:PAS/PAC sensor hybrid histidine kinase [Caballeronia calidae]